MTTTLTDEIRACWYDLSQGVLDIVVKLFVLAQLRAIANKKERVTVGILQSVYKQELKPVHPMLDALRSGDADKIVKYSDLRVVDLDKRLIQLGAEIFARVEKHEKKLFGGNKEALRLYNIILQIDPAYDELTVSKLVKRIFKEHPDLSISQMIPILVGWYESNEEMAKATKAIKTVKEKDWIDLEVDDLRYQFAYCKENNISLVERLESNSEMFDLDAWAAGY